MGLRERVMSEILTDISDPLLHLDVCGHANQKLELGICGSQPKRRDQASEDDRAHRINPPLQLASTYRRQESEAVDDDIVAMIFPEDMDLRVDVAKRPAIEKEGQLSDESDTNRDDRW